MTALHNTKNREELQQDLNRETFPRVAASFYRYTPIEEPMTLRNTLYLSWFDLGVLGRVYLATEGINAQVSVPEPNWLSFVESLQQLPQTKDLFINRSNDNGKTAFLKLSIKVRNHIVADGLEEDIFSISSTGKHLSPTEFHQKLNEPNVLAVDTRNDYECETGHFESALLPSANLFSEVLPELKERLRPHKDKKLLLYCTGGIRCEKAAAYLKKEGYQEVYQLQGGIIHYLNTARQTGFVPKFKGSTFVFDGRMAEPTVGRIVGRCYSCAAPHDIHTDCANEKCHKLILQCKKCENKFSGCCSKECQEVLSLNQPC